VQSTSQSEPARRGGGGKGREGRGAVAWTPAEVESGEERERERRESTDEGRKEEQKTGKKGREREQSVSQVRASRTAWEWTA
jgi:hypothetical protein